jgi:SRSO17 transposase
MKNGVAKQKIKYARLVIDDFLSEKSGEHIEGVGWDGSGTTYSTKSILAHNNMISSHYIAGTFHVPLDFDIYIKRKDCRDKSKFWTKIEIAKDLISKAKSYGLPISVVIFDSWYAGEKLLKFIKEDLKIEAYVTEEKSDRVILSDDSKAEMNLAEFKKMISREKFEPADVFTSILLGKKETFYASSTAVRMKHLNGVKVKLASTLQEQGAFR